MQWIIRDPEGKEVARLEGPEAPENPENMPDCVFFWFVTNQKIALIRAIDGFKWRGHTWEKVVC